MLSEPGLDMSFSGLKTAVALAIARAEERAGGALPAAVVDDLAASFQEAAVDVLVEKTRRAIDLTGISRLVVVGGLAANSRLRERMSALAAELPLTLALPPVRLCTDNAAMVASVADRLLVEGRVATLDLEAFSRIPLPQMEEGKA